LRNKFATATVTVNIPSADNFLECSDNRGPTSTKAYCLSIMLCYRPNHFNALSEASRSLMGQREIDERRL